MSELNQTMELNQITDAVRRFIVEHFPPARRRTLGDGDPLIESGIIDSLGVLDVVSFIESEFKVTIVDDDLTPENFRSIGQMAAFVENKRNGLA